MAYYNPSGLQSTFGTQRVDGTLFNTSPEGVFGRDFYDDAQDGRFGYEQFLQGIGGSTPFASWLRNRSYQTRSEYGAAQPKQPDLTWTNYLVQNQDRLLNEFANSNPTQRGQQPERLSKLRWLN